jgi:hypothetical protein
MNEEQTPIFYADPEAQAAFERYAAVMKQHQNSIPVCNIPKPPSTISKIVGAAMSLLLQLWF